jgi:thiol:disulfide interchange protein DsbA
MRQLLVPAFLVLVVSTVACAKEPAPVRVAASPTAATQPATPTATPTAATAAPSGRWSLGTNYQRLAAPQPTSVGTGKVEVVEVFWYGCNHCYALEPVLKSWQKSKPGFIEFVKVPVVWQAPHKQHARLFYTIEALKRPDLHAKVFDEFHQRRNYLAANTDAEARALHLAFMKASDIKEADFTKAYDSFDVSNKVARAEQLTRRYQVDGVPRVVINGKYSTDVGMAGGQQQLIALINDVSAGERR